MAFSSWYYGIDLNSAPPFPCAGSGSNYYIGNIGGGTTAGGGAFNTTAATTVGFALTFGVWNLWGTAAKPSGVTPTQWGIDQGNAAVSAWYNNSYVGGQTLFCDIESGNYWNSSSLTDNQEILQGFLSTVRAYNSGQLTVGIYISSSNWTSYFGSTYTSTNPFVWWVAGSNCPSGCSGAATEFNSTYANASVGGYKAMIWQYWPVNPGCSTTGAEQDITPYNGYLSGRWNPTT